MQCLSFDTLSDIMAVLGMRQSIEVLHTMPESNRKCNGVSTFVCPMAMLSSAANGLHFQRVYSQCDKTQWMYIMLFFCERYVHYLRDQTFKCWWINPFILFIFYKLVCQISQNKLSGHMVPFVVSVNICIKWFHTKRQYPVLIYTCAIC